MKLEYNESGYALELILIPETPKETAQILRFTNNARAEKPSIWFSFSGDEPKLEVIMEKKKLGNQINSINVFRKK